MSEENNSSYQFSKLFERVKRILDGKIDSIEEGPASAFRLNINSAIGTLPEIDSETGHIKKTGDSYSDGTGMSGAVYAMGDMIDIGLSEIDSALTNAINATAEAQSAARDARSAATDVTQSIIDIGVAKDNAEAAASAAVEAKINAETAVNTGWGYSDLISGKTDRILVVSSANSSSDARPFVVKDGREQVVTQIKGGVWFKVLGEERITYGGAEIDDVNSTSTT